MRRVLGFIIFIAGLAFVGALGIVLYRALFPATPETPVEAVEGTTGKIAIEGWESAPAPRKRAAKPRSKPKPRPEASQRPPLPDPVPIPKRSAAPPRPPLPDPVPIPKRSAAPPSRPAPKPLPTIEKPAAMPTPTPSAGEEPERKRLRVPGFGETKFPSSGSSGPKSGQKDVPGF